MAGDVQAVVFDLDGVLIDSEQLWDVVRRGLADEAGRPWPAEATRAMQGMSTAEWSTYLTDVVGVPGKPEDVAVTVIDRMAARYDAQLPLLPGAVEVVAPLAPWARVVLAAAADRHRAGGHGVGAAIPGQRLHGGGGGRKALACGVSDRGAAARGGFFAGSRDRGLEQRVTVGRCSRSGCARGAPSGLSALGGCAGARRRCGELTRRDHPGAGGIDGPPDS